MDKSTKGQGCSGTPNLTMMDLFKEQWSLMQVSSFLLPRRGTDVVLMRSLAIDHIEPVIIS